MQHGTQNIKTYYNESPFCGTGFRNRFVIQRWSVMSKKKCVLVGRPVIDTGLSIVSICCGHARMVVAFTHTYVISACHHCELHYYPHQGILDTTIYHKSCQWYVNGLLFWKGTTVSSINTTNDYIANILLKISCL